MCERGSTQFNDSAPQRLTALENEVRSFIDFIHGKPCITNYNHAVKVATFLDAIEKSIEQRKVVNLELP